MKGIIIYKSRTGFTQRYAQWISEELKYDIESYQDIRKDSIEQYDLVIYGGNLYAGKIDGLAKIKDLVSNNKKCRLMVFATGASPAEAEEEIDKVWSENLSAEELKEVPHFYMPGGLNYEKMGFVDRTLMRIFSKMMEKKKDKTASDEECAKAITASYDISSKDYIKPLVKYIKEGKLA